MRTRPARDGCVSAGGAAEAWCALRAPCTRSCITSRVRIPSPSYAGSLLISAQLACMRLVLCLRQGSGIMHRSSPPGCVWGLGARGIPPQLARVGVRFAPRLRLWGPPVWGAPRLRPRLSPQAPHLFALSVYLRLHCPSFRCPFLLSLPTRTIPSLNPCPSTAYSRACRWRRALATVTPSLPGPCPVARGSSFGPIATQPRGRPLCSPDLATAPAADVLGWVSSAGPSILGPSP